MITLIVWSKDRACQLDFLLRSIDKNAPFFDVNVIYKTSNEKFEDGYSKLFELHPNVTFHKEKNLEEDTLALIENGNEYICFSTDDQVFYRDVSKSDIKSLLPKYDNEVFSFRLGLNTIVQDCHAGTFQPVLRNFEQKGVDGISWPCLYYAVNDNYGYPLALDTHVFTRSKILDLLEKCSPWTSTNVLEGKMQVYRNDISVINSFSLSSSVNIPCNNMSGLTRSGETVGFSVEVLNNLFLEGYSISVDWDSVSVIGCHQEIGFDLKNGQDV